MGQGEYNNKPVCPSCQAKEFGTNFNTGCGDSQKSCLLKGSKSDEKRE